VILFDVAASAPPPAPRIVVDGEARADARLSAGPAYPRRGFMPSAAGVGRQSCNNLVRRRDPMDGSIFKVRPLSKNTATDAHDIAAPANGSLNIYEEGGATVK
jgi:hypothetical protein